MTGVQTCALPISDSWRPDINLDSDKKSASTTSSSNLLPSLLCYAHTPAKAVVSQSADKVATSALHHWRVDTSCPLPQPQNAFSGDFLLGRHDSSTSDRCFICLHRPVHGTEHITPDALHIYHKTHQFLGPCCLCPLLWLLSESVKATSNHKVE